MRGGPRLLLLVPALLGGGLASLLVGLVISPAWQRLQAREAELTQLREREQTLPLLRAQLLKELEASDRARNRRNLVLTMVEGSGGKGTLMAQVGQLAQRAGVQVTLYEPQAGASPAAAGQPGQPAAAAGAAGGKAPPPPPSDPLAVEGLRRQSLILSARGRFPALLTLVRELERLSVLVVQSNLELSLEKAERERGETADPVALKLELGLYSRPAPSSNRPPSRPRATATTQQDP